MSTPAKAPQDITTPPWAKRRSYFDLLLGASCVILIISNIAATKGIEFGPLPFELPPFTNGNFIPSDGGFFLYPLAYVLGDVLSEVYGFKRARRAIIASFVAAAFAAGCFLLTVALPPASYYENQEAFAIILGPVWQIFAGSLLGYLTGQLRAVHVGAYDRFNPRGRAGGYHYFLCDCFAYSGDY